MWLMIMANEGLGISRRISRWLLVSTVTSLADPPFWTVFFKWNYSHIIFSRILSNSEWVVISYIYDTQVSEQHQTIYTHGYMHGYVRLNKCV